MKTAKLRALTTFLVIFSVLAQSATALAGKNAVYTNTRMLADNLEYVDTVNWDAESGRRTETFSVAMTGPGDAYPIVMKGDTVFGGSTISRMTAYAEGLGKNLLAAVNTDFFAENAVPIGIVVEEGVYKSSSSGRNAVTFGYNGSVHIVESPTVRITISNEGGPEDAANKGKEVTFSHFNKVRGDFGGMCLLSEAFSTVSTRTASPGWFVRFSILEGELSVSGEMKLEVVETLTSDGAIPIGAGYLVLTAADLSELTSEYEKFAVGDIVTLTTSCDDEWLTSAQYAMGGGDILISDGVVTDATEWAQSLRSRAPRTAFGMLEDGTVVSYVVDGRNPDHSNGMTLDELAGEMLRQGCVYAVNLDGGGSTALSVRIPGDSSASVVNRPSDGAERVCSTYLLFVTDAEPDGVAKYLSLRNDGALVLSGSSIELSFAARDSGYMPVEAPDDIVAELSDTDAVISGALYTEGDMTETLYTEGDMQETLYTEGDIPGTLYTAGDIPGTNIVTLYSGSADAYGTGEITTITEPTSIKATMKGSVAPLTSARIAPGATLEFDVFASYYNRAVTAQPHSFKYEVTGDIGEMQEPGVFIAGLKMGEKGKIVISAGETFSVIAIEIADFVDMRDHWAKDYAEFLMQAGITIGISETEYGPSLLMKRCDFILMLYRAAGEPELQTALGFDDVPMDAYYARAMIWARENMIAEGEDGNNFYPQMPLLRQDAFTFTYRTLGILEKLYEDGEPEDLDVFPDTWLLSEYAVVPTATLYRLLVVEGMNGELRPLDTMTRAEMAKVLTVVLQLESVMED